MARTINKVELLGRVGIEPEMRYTPGGTAVANIRLATDRYRRDAEDETDWHTVVVWNKLAEAVNDYVTKGQRLYVSGRLVHSSWEGDDGQRRYRAEVHAQDVVFLDSANGQPTAGHEDNGNAGQRAPVSPFE